MYPYPIVFIVILAIFIALAIATTLLVRFLWDKAKSKATKRRDDSICLYVFFICVKLKTSYLVGRENMYNFILILFVIFATFAFLYLIYIILVYFKTKVPYVVTPKKYFSIIFKHLNINSQSIVYDLGCGKGDFLFAAERYNPKKLIGFELSPLHAWYGIIKAKISKSKVKIHCQDFFKSDIREANIIYLFLVKPILIKAWQKIQNEAKKGALVIVLADEIPGAKYQKVFKSAPESRNSSSVFIYEV